jgi:hypothetical protein
METFYPGRMRAQRCECTAGAGGMENKNPESLFNEPKVRLAYVFFVDFFGLNGQLRMCRAGGSEIPNC